MENVKKGDKIEACGMVVTVEGFDKFGRIIFVDLEGLQGIVSSKNVTLIIQEPENCENDAHESLL